jgi:hypothetical protein
MIERTIWKYELEVMAREQLIDMPDDSVIVRVGSQEKTVCLWAIVCPQNIKVTRVFFITGTGHPAHKVWDYVGSASMGPFEWHVWECPQ